MGRLATSLALAGSLLLTGCGAGSHFPPSLFETVEPCAWGDGRTVEPVMDESRSAWYSSHLRAAGEPRLSEAAHLRATDGVAVLRFTWLRSFDAPVSVRVEATADGGFQLTGTELSGAGGYDPGRLVREVSRELSVGEAARLSALLDRTGVLDLPPAENCPVQPDGSLIVHGDGAHWIIEANGPDGYRFIDRWSAEGAVREVGLHLIGLTGWTYDRIY